MINFNTMNSFNEINLKISFGSSGSDQEQSGSLLKNSGAPPPPNGNYLDIEASGSEFSLPPPPGFSSESTTHSSFPSAYSGGEGPAPPDAPGDQRGTEIQNFGPPETGIKNTPASKDSFPPPPQEDKSKSPNKTGKGKS